MTTIVIKRALLVLATAAALLAQPKSTSLPRTPDGKSDLSGVWAGPMLPQGMDLKNVKLPIRAGMENQFFRKATGDMMKDDPTMLCLPNGMPREVLSPFPTQILQPQGFVVIVYEYEHFTRVIPTDHRKHNPDHDPNWMGDSVGWWEGDTFVVDTVGLKEWELDAAHDPQHWHSDKLHLQERYTRTAADVLKLDLTIDDPKFFTAPWTMSWNMALRNDWHIMEHICEENNKEIDMLRKMQENK